ncbi:hypothetical protein RMS29_028275 (plasmid) [Agrobacterium rosae]|uniref:DUF4376 domain-containing protein n=1 Tax=Agrobacterium rosae TaxID=1972867 RepID=A0ABU4W530_9HYPH|nr:hypothetical protein [Agrobacterium rosae]MDX8332884.1 hypothetical protein [Agrobacterium rosae]
MYSIDNNYYPMIEATLAAQAEGKVTRWMASFAWWLGRQSIQNEDQFWFRFAGKATAMLDAADQDAIAAQLRKPEEAFVDAEAEWPEIPSGLQQLIATWSPSREIDLDALKAQSVIKVDRSAEQYRLNFITAGSGQTMAYQQKLEEARKVVADPDIADAEVPHIVAEAGVDGVSKMDKAQQIVATFDAWQIISAGIEAKRMTAKRDIAAAETADEVQAAAAVQWAGE